MNILNMPEITPWWGKENRRRKTGRFGMERAGKGEKAELHWYASQQRYRSYLYLPGFVKHFIHICSLSHLETKRPGSVSTELENAAVLSRLSRLHSTVHSDQKFCGRIHLPYKAFLQSILFFKLPSAPSQLPSNLKQIKYSKWFTLSSWRSTIEVIVWWLHPHAAAHVWSLDDNWNMKSSALTKTSGDADSIYSFSVFSHMLIVF